ncbi:zinc finger protein [Cinnamomum micranthum f. kanehirae]|uniref:RING-type E3 ubiquitin transferase n=1 Tax=Cinnamomum micranthum f. kanehirae TaxID=337451 RepID=A0A3S3P9B5_9MAGN|nr:zinc finger protein [Cinnamomum micranthum f. kanehirae]
MLQRNMLCTGQRYDFEIESGQSHHQLEPCILSGNMVDFPNPNSHSGLPLSGNITNRDSQHPPDHHESNIFYGNHHNSLQHRPPVSNLNLGGTGPNISFNPYAVPSSASRIFPMPLNNGSDYIASSSNHGIAGIGVDEYGRNHHLMDNVRGSGKRKNAEGLPGNYYYANGVASSSSSSLGVPMNSGPQQREEPYVPRIGALEAATFNPSEYNGSGVLSTTEGPQRSVRSRSSAMSQQLDSSFAHHHSQLGDHMSQSFQPSSGPWPEQFGYNSSNGGISNWNYGPSRPNMHGRSISGGPLEVGSMGRQGHQDATSSRNSGNILHPTTHHHHPQQAQGMRSHTYSYHPQLPAPSYRHLANNFNRGTLTPRDGLESGSRYSRPLMSNTERIYRPQRRAAHAAPDDLNRRMRLLSSDDVAMMEYSGFYGVGNFIDQHRDMRLDIDDMSYEELLALEERIGDVNTGLSEETISSCLKTRRYVLCTVSSPSDQPADMVMLDKETCIICQAEYEESEKIGILDCGHDYHADCIKQWLLVKNICPICKASALAVDKKNE